MSENNYTVTIPLEEYKALLENQLMNCIALNTSVITEDLVIGFDNQKVYEAAMNLLARQVAVDPESYNVVHFSEFYVCSATIATLRNPNKEDD
jgi:hypothetical protein